MVIVWKRKSSNDCIYVIREYIDGNKLDMEEVVAPSNNLERVAEEIKECLKSFE